MGFKLHTTRKPFSMNKMGKGFIPIIEERQKQKTAKVGSLMKRLVSKVTKEKDNSTETAESRRWSRWKIPSRRQRLTDGELEHPMPEILRVSPRCTSCEVTLISSKDDTDAKHQNAVTQEGNAEPDNCYHMVLNPHRRTRTKYFEDDDDDNQHDVADHGKTEATNESTTDLSSSLDLNGQEKTTVETFFAGRDFEELHFVRDSDDEEDHDQQQIPNREYFMSQRHSIHYKSLFVVSDSECDDDFSEQEDREYWENYENWHRDRDFQIDFARNEKQQALNTTADTSLIEDGGDESSLSSRDEDLPVEITVPMVAEFAET